MTETLPILKAQGVSQSYGGTPVLRQVDVTLPPDISLPFWGQTDVASRRC